MMGFLSHLLISFCNAYIQNHTFVPLQLMSPRYSIVASLKKQMLKLANFAVSVDPSCLPVCMQVLQLLHISFFKMMENDIR